MDQTQPPAQPAAPVPQSTHPPLQPPVQPPAPPPAPKQPDMADTVMETAKKYSPLKASWWVALVQGLIAAGLGILLLIYPQQAVDAIGPFLALYLLIHGLFEVAGGSNKPRTSSADQIAYFRGIVGAVIGGFLISLLFLGLLTRETGLLWLSIGLLLYGVGGLYLAFARARGNGRILSLIGAILFVALGAIGLWGTFSESGQMITIIAWTLIVLGIGLVVMAFVRRSNAKKEEEDAKAEAAKKK